MSAADIYEAFVSGWKKHASRTHEVSEKDGTEAASAYITSKEVIARTGGGSKPINLGIPPEMREPSPFLAAEDGEFNGNAPVDDNMPIAATDDRDVDWIDVTGWGVFKGHAVPVDVARHIAEKINLYASARRAPDPVREKLVEALREWLDAEDTWDGDFADDDRIARAKEAARAALAETEGRS